MESIESRRSKYALRSPFFVAHRVEIEKFTHSFLFSAFLIGE
jgi:hypothetical protein